MSANILETARAYAAAGLSVIPIRPDGSKAAACPWAEYQKEIAGPDELETQFGKNGVGVAVITGQVSGNLEVIDGDDIAAYRKFRALVLKQQGGKELLERLVAIQTPRPGVQLWYRCKEGIEPSQKLARRLTGKEVKTLLETRGEAAYVLAPGCPLACHSTGRPYELKRGDILNPPIITAQERALLLNTARSLNEFVEPANVHKPLLAQGGNGERPGDDFNRRAMWKELLEPAGWRFVFESKGVSYWRRPGKAHGISATTNYGGADLFYPFSTNAAPFEPEHSYSKFAVFARLNHAGDYQAAAKDLLARGYGKTRPADDAPPIGDEMPADEMPADHEPPKIEWPLWDAADFMRWPDEKLEWIVEPHIPKKGVGFFAAPPKDRKSLLALDLALHLAQPEPTRLWLGKYKVSPGKVLFISREDPQRRVRDRMIEICDSYGRGNLPIPPPGRLKFMFRERISLNEPAHISWLKGAARAVGAEILFLDVLNRMIPGVDQSKGVELAKIVDIIEALNRELQITIIVLDHTRKPAGGQKGGRDSQEPNSFNLYGGVEKYGAAEFIFNISRTPEPSRIKIKCENKDADEPPLFLVDVSPKDSGRPKFSYAGDVEKIAGDMRAVGAANRELVLEALDSVEGRTRSDIEARVPTLKATSIKKHLTALISAGRAAATGYGKNIEYRKVIGHGETSPRPNPDNSCDINT